MNENPWLLPRGAEFEQRAAEFIKRHGTRAANDAAKAANKQLSGADRKIMIGTPEATEDAIFRSRR